MRKLSGWVGIFLDAWTGPCKTSIYQGEVKHRILQIRPDANGRWLDVNVECRQVIYYTRYERVWIFNRHHSVYEVSLKAPETTMEKVDCKLRETVTYPMLCNRFLKWTHYPHIYAINAFLDRVDDASVYPFPQRKESS